MKHTKAIQGKDNHAKAIQALNEEQIRMRKAVIQNQMALDMLTAAQGGICAIIKVECCVSIPDLSGKVSATLDDMKNQVKAMSNDNPPFWTSLFSWIKGDWWKIFCNNFVNHYIINFGALYSPVYNLMCNLRTDNPAAVT